MVFTRGSNKSSELSRNTLEQQQMPGSFSHVPDYIKHTHIALHHVRARQNCTVSFVLGGEQE